MLQNPPKIAILGAGINGISTALAIQQRLEDCDVTVISSEFSPNTTSDVAAGLVEPYLCNDSVDKIMSWTKSTILRIQEYMKTGLPGAEEMSGYWLQSTQEVPKWLEVMKHYKVLSPQEMEQVRKRPEHKFGVFYTTWYLEPTAYIKWSSEQFLRSGGKFVEEKVESIEEFASRGGYDLIVNCTGLASGKLFNDADIRPIRGQIMRVRCPRVKHFLIDDDYYALLNDNCIILGGTKTENDWNLTIDPLTATRIFEENCKNIPSLRSAEILSHHVGLRPSRATVRLEVDRKDYGGLKVVHNYGHGGSGITLHWGCALEAAELVEKVLREAGGRGGWKSRI